MALEMPPPPLAGIEAPRPVGAGAEPRLLLQDAKPPQDAQPPLKIPQTDLSVEVVGRLPLREKLESVSRLLVSKLDKKLDDLKKYFR